MTPPGRYTKAGLIRSENLVSMPGRTVQLPAKLEDEQEKEKWLQQLQDPSVPKIIDLFCGAGGMSDGFVNAGFVVVAGLDHDKDACNTFAANISAKVYCEDISQTDPAVIVKDLPDFSVDVIVGGPPCQGFSIGGQARIRSLDEVNRQTLLARNELYQQYFRFIEYFRPKFFVMENVPALKSFNDKAYIKGIEQECQRLGYFPDIEIVDAAEYGVPQVRRRLIVVGCRLGKFFRLPRRVSAERVVPLQDAIGDLPAVKPPSLEECLPYNTPDNTLSLYQKLMRSRVRNEDRKYIYEHIVRPVREDDQYIFSHMKPGDRYIDIEEKYRRYNADTFKDKYYMLRPGAPGVTITAHLSKDGYRYIHWDTEQHRTISVREAARIQSFGDHFLFTGSRSARFRQIGNAVPPLLAEAIAEQIQLALRRGQSGMLQLGLFEHGQKDNLVGTHE